MTNQSNETETTIYSLALTEAKYLVNSGKLNPEHVNHLIHLRRTLRERLQELRASDQPYSLLEESCKEALEELQKGIKEVAPHGWNFEMEVYKTTRASSLAEEDKNEWVRSNGK